MEEVFGTNEVFTVSGIESQIRSILVQGFSDAVAESKISALDLAANYQEFSQQIMDCCQDGIKKIGLKLTSMVLENISLPDEVEKALDERTKLGIMEDKMGTFTQYQAAQAMRDAAQNPSGGNLAGIGVGLGAGVAMGQTFAGALATENKPREKAEKCIKCGASLKANAKFCPECGAKQTMSCPKCNASITPNDKFCPECGQSLKNTCPKCAAELKDGAKFCPECGEKLGNGN